MAKALLGHLAVAPDRRLVDELLHLRTRVRDLESELAELRAERAELIAELPATPVGEARLDSQIERLQEVDEPALAGSA